MIYINNKNEISVHTLQMLENKLGTLDSQQHHQDGNRIWHQIEVVHLWKEK